LLVAWLLLMVPGACTFMVPVRTGISSTAAPRASRIFMPKLRNAEATLQ
jgi:hypothetical protein